MNVKEIQAILNSHKQWLLNGSGQRAYLQRAYLQGAYLQGADLQRAYLQRAYLQGADLQGADLQGAYLQDADLRGAYLQDADLRGAYLQDADLRGAYLQDADLRGADLQDAYLQGADLQGADLPHFQIPQQGLLTVYKKVAGHIVTLQIPNAAQRTANIINRKCRASCAFVLDIENTDSVYTHRGNGLEYRIGQWVFPDSYDSDIRVDCTHGIHFFLTRKEAEEF